MSTTNGACDSTTVWPNSVAISATKATVDARCGSPVAPTRAFIPGTAGMPSAPPAITHAAVVAAAVVPARRATACHSAG
ncbi:Uncharacterised protein [Mycobacterium tuberculosis]|nr:Uncharacterised protein [Mycobacterium tuberculosis]